MLTRLVAAAAATVLGLAGLGAGTAFAAGGDCSGDYCEGDVVLPGTPGGPPDSGNTGGGGSTGAGGPRVPTPWEIYADCVANQASTGVVCVAPDPGTPGNPAAPPDPAVVAQLAKARLKLNPPAIGSAPCTDPGCMGAVGVPVWLWVDGGFPTQTATATVRGVSVTITARMSRIDWTMGDGSTVPCTTPGTAYTTAIGWAKSPDCGYLYERKGTYPITANATWDVTFTGDYVGTDTATSQNQVTATIGEYQVIVTG